MHLRAVGGLEAPDEGRTLESASEPRQEILNLLRERGRRNVGEFRGLV
jgi:hypothetical protein